MTPNTASWLFWAYFAAVWLLFLTVVTTNTEADPPAAPTPTVGIPGVDIGQTVLRLPNGNYVDCMYTKTGNPSVSCDWRSRRDRP